MVVLLIYCEHQYILVGYEGGQSDSDEEDEDDSELNKVVSVGGSNPQLPVVADFWLILQPMSDRVEMFFHTRLVCWVC